MIDVYTANCKRVGSFSGAAPFRRPEASPHGNTRFSAMAGVHERNPNPSPRRRRHWYRYPLQGAPPVHPAPGLHTNNLNSFLAVIKPKFAAHAAYSARFARQLFLFLVGAWLSARHVGRDNRANSAALKAPGRPINFLLSSGSWSHTTVWASSPLPSLLDRVPGALHGQTWGLNDLGWSAAPPTC